MVFSPDPMLPKLSWSSSSSLPLPLVPVVRLSPLVAPSDHERSQRAGRPSKKQKKNQRTLEDEKNREAQRREEKRRQEKRRDEKRRDDKRKRRDEKR